MENEYGNYLDDDKKLKEYGDKLAELRRNGVGLPRSDTTASIKFPR